MKYKAMTINRMNRNIMFKMAKRFILIILFSLFTTIYAISAITMIMPDFAETGIVLILILESIYVLVFIVSALDKNVFYDKYEYFLGITLFEFALAFAVGLSIMFS